MKNTSICLLIFVCMFSFQTQITAQNSQQLFQQGMIQEEAEGDLKAAITIYNKIVNNVSVDRNLRAKALLQVGICYEKLGDNKDRKTYQKLITEYSDQEAIVALGREKLKGLKHTNSITKKDGIIATQVWSPAQDTYGVSPNGRYLNYINWNNISLDIKDLHTGTTKALTNKGTWKLPIQFPDNSMWSPDGKKLAYCWFIQDDTELHIINVDGTSDRVIAKGKSGTAPWPVAWTPDGKYILGISSYIVKNKMSHKMVLVSVDDGSVKVLKDFKNISCGGSMDISPNNKYIVYSLQQKENSKQKDIYILSMDGSVDKKLVKHSANDTDPVWSANGKEILFVSDRYGTNDLWKLRVENGNPIGVAEIVKVDLGSKYRLFKITKDESVYFGTLNLRNDVYTVNLSNSLGNDAALHGEKISKLSVNKNIDPFWSKDGRYVGYVRFPKSRNYILGRKFLITIYDTKTKSSKDIDTGIYGDPDRFEPLWLPDGKSILFNGILKNSMRGGLFLFDVNTGKKTEIDVSKNMTIQKIGKYTRRHSISQDGKSIYYISRDRISILKFDVISKKETKIYSGTEYIYHFKVSNDDSKIVFGHWYSEDRKKLYVVSTSGGEKREINGVETSNIPIIISWSSDDKWVYYQYGNFRDVKKIMRVSVDKGIAEEVLMLKDVFDSGTIIDVSMLPDGQHLAVELEVGLGGEVWKLEGIFKD